MIPAVEQFAEVLIARGDDAEAVVERATKLRERKFGADADEVVAGFEHFANLFHGAGQVKLADDYFSRASNLRDRHAHALFV